MGFFADVGPLTVFVSHQVRLLISLGFGLLTLPAHPPGLALRPKL
jgi:hypothetical protein